MPNRPFPRRRQRLATAAGTYSELEQKNMNQDINATSRITYGASVGGINHSESPVAPLHLAPLSPESWETLGRIGYAPLDPILPAAFMDALPGEIERLIEKGWMRPPADRIVNGRPTEHLVTLGVVHGNPLGAPIFQASAPLAALFRAMQTFGHAFNANRRKLIASGLVSPEEAPEIAVEGLDMNHNRVVEGWTGLHPHEDQLRFTAGAMRLPKTSIRHQLQQARVVTVSGYSRPLTATGARLHDLGGALTFHVRKNVRGPEDKAIHDVVSAVHGTGAVFFAHTMHGVARMTAPGSVRYSFQAFFPARAVWDEVVPRIDRGELMAELLAERAAAAANSQPVR